MHLKSLPLHANTMGSCSCSSLLKAMVVADIGLRKSLNLVSQNQQTDVLVPQRSHEILLWILRYTGLVPVGKDPPHGPSVEGEVPARTGVDKGPAHFRVKLFGQVPGLYLPDIAVVHSVQQGGVDRLAQKTSDLSVV